MDPSRDPTQTVTTQIRGCGKVRKYGQNPNKDMEEFCPTKIEMARQGHLLLQSFTEIPMRLDTKFKEKPEKSLKF